MLAIYRWINYCTRLCRDVRIIIIDGPPGSGKSTVASKMADVLSYEHIEVDEFIDRTIRAINYELLAHINCGIQGGFIISGYPLTEDNIKFISNNLDVSAIFLLNCTTHTSYLRQKIDTYSAKYRLDMYNKHLHNHELLRNMLHVPILYVDANRQLTNVISDITDTMNKIYSDNEDIIYPISGGCKKTKENHYKIFITHDTHKLVQQLYSQYETQGNIYRYTASLKSVPDIFNYKNIIYGNMGEACDLKYIKVVLEMCKHFKCVVELSQYICESVRYHTNYEYYVENFKSRVLHINDFENIRTLYNFSMYKLCHIFFINNGEEQPFEITETLENEMWWVFKDENRWIYQIEEILNCDIEGCYGLMRNRSLEISMLLSKYGYNVDITSRIVLLHKVILF